MSFEKGPPSLAQAQLNQGMSQAAAAAAQQANMARGGNMAGSQLASAQTGAALAGQQAEQAAVLQAQEQQAAMAAQAGLAGQMAQQGLQGQLGLEGQYQGALANQLNADVTYRLGSRQAREAERQGHNQRVSGNVSAGTLGIVSDERAKTNIAPVTGTQIQAQNPYAGAAHPEVARAGGLINNVLGGDSPVGGIVSLAGLLSDEETKRNIRPGNIQASQAVGELNPYTFEYKAGYDDSGAQRIGVMAQDMERVAPQAVVDTPQGKVIDTAQATGLSLAASADQEQRLRAQQEQIDRMEGLLASAASPLPVAGSGGY